MDIQENVSLTPFNTFGLDARARYFAVAESAADIEAADGLAEKAGMPLHVLGAGSNVVLTGDLPGLTLQIGLRGRSCSGSRLTAAGGEDWDALVEFAAGQGAYGLENLSMIPGTVGAAPVQNIGAYGIQLSDLFVGLTAWDREHHRFVGLDAAACGFGYRDSIFKSAARGRYIISEVTLAVSREFKPILSYPGVAELAGSAPDAAAVRDAVVSLRASKLPDPKVQPNVGSFFKNPVVDPRKRQALLAAFPDLTSWDAESGYKLSAGWLIDQAGCKGMSVGGVAVSDQHALVFVNLGSGSPDDVVELTRRVRSRVLETFGVSLDVEPDWFPRKA